jgi:hydroxymethylpyrimidine kinase/phosphomethylpyrimidine kinase
MNRLRLRKKVLAIGGSDSSGGAGVQADVKSLSSIGVHACVVITCITAQNTMGVRKVFPLPAEVVTEQFEAVMTDIAPPVVKASLMATPQVVRAVAKGLKRYNVMFVLDPVMRSTSGDGMVSDGYLDAIRGNLLPITDLLTPNLEEAGNIVGWEVRTLEDMRAAAIEIAGKGPSHVLIKGGHLDGELAIDMLYDSEKRRYHLFKAKKMPRDLHGTGCTLSALIAGHLAKGRNMKASVQMAKDIITKNIQYGYDIGHGNHVVDSHSHLFNSVQMFRTQQELREAVERLKSRLIPDVVPEVGINIGYALPYANDRNDVCAIKGRIIKAGSGITVAGDIEFGASHHIANIILTAMEADQRIRSCMNIAYSEAVIEAARLLTLEVQSFDREEEPDDAKSTLAWGTAAVIKRTGRVPDVIFDLGGHGKEPMVRLLGNNPKEVVDNLEMIIEEAFPQRHKGPKKVGKGVDEDAVDV